MGFKDPVLTAAAAGIASAIAVAIAKWGGRQLLGYLRGSIELVREFREYRAWRAQGGQGPPRSSGPDE